MTEQEFLELIRRTMQHQTFNEATSCVLILFRENEEGVQSYIRGFFNGENVQAIMHEAHGAVATLPDLVDEENGSGLQ